jgi:hypothetical protein
MFNFGLFSTHIPYILLLALHVVYFGIYTFNKLSESKTEKQLAEKVVEFQNNEDNQESAFYYSDYFTSNSKSKFKPQKVLVLSIRKIDEFAYYCSDGFSGLVFSRPPPYVLCEV